MPSPPLRCASGASRRASSTNAGERVRADESGDLAGARVAHLRAPPLDHRPVEIDEVATSRSARPSVRSRPACKTWARERPSLRRVRRRQSLLRGARRVHPLRRPEDAAALRAVVRGQRAQVPRRRRHRQPRGREPHVRPGRQGRRDARLLPRQPEQAAAVRVPARARADPGRVPRPRRAHRQARRVRPRSGVAVPDARHPLRGAASSTTSKRSRRCSPRSTAGSTTTGASTTRAASSRRRTSRSPISTGRSASSNGRSTTARATS